MVAACVATLAFGTGCTSLAALDAPFALVRPESEPPIDTAAADTARAWEPPIDADATEPDWSTSVREGRAALHAHDFDRAAARFVSALEAATRFRSRDVRVAASFGHVVRVASVYERVGRVEDAERLMARLEAVAGDRHDGARWAAEARTRYAKLVQQPLHARLVPADMPRPPASQSYDRLIRTTADAFEVDPALVKAVVAAESNFERRAVSRVGAQGLMQLMPETARDLGVRRPFTPRENIRGGVRYLRSLLDRFEDVDLALAAYNAGPEAVVRYGGIPPYPETEEYVSRVRRHYERYQTRFAR